MKICYLFAYCILLLSPLFDAQAQVKIIQTIAGSNSTGGLAGDNGPATAARFNTPYGITYDNATGNLYVADMGNGRIRKVNTNTGVITTFAGGGFTLSEGVAATAVFMSAPMDVAVDAAGNVYITENNGYRVKKVSASDGLVRTIAGTGSFGYSGDGFPATAAQVSGPRGIVVDGAGNVYFSESAPSGSSGHIRKINTAGIISTFAGTGFPGSAGDGGLATAASFSYPTGLAFDAAGDLLVADLNGHRIRKITMSSGMINLVAGTSIGFSGDGAAAVSAQFSSPPGIEFDASGNLYIADGSNMRIRMVNTGGTISTVAGSSLFMGFGGDGGPATAALLNNPASVAFTPSGSYYIADKSNQRIRIVKPNTAPAFTGATPITINVCANSGPNSITTFLGVTDPDYPQTETWTLVSGPVNGTAVVSGTTTSTGSGILPLGGPNTYQPNPSYTGYDSFKVQVSDGYDFSVATIYVNVNSYAGVISGPALTCVGTTTTMSDFVSGGTWGSSNTAIFTVSLAGVVTALSTGTADITYTVTTAPCTSSYTIKTLTVTETPAASPITGPPTVCAGSSVGLSSAVTGGTWDTDGTGTATITTSGLLSGVTAGTALITYTIGNMCGTAAATTVITINPLPDAGTITGPSSVCAGAVALMADAVAGGTWSYSNTTATISVGGAVTGLSAGPGIVSYSVTNICGTANAIHAMTILDIPSSGMITGPSSVCTGATVTLVNAAPAGVWTAVGMATISSAGVVTGLAVGTADVTYTVGNVCGSANTSRAITINDLIYPGTISGLASVCQGASILLTDPVPGGVWTSGSSAATVSGTGMVTGVSAGVAHISYNITNMCGTSSATMPVLVDPAVTPSVSIAASPGTVLCNTTTPVSFSASSINGGSAPVYEWRVNGIVTGGSGPSYGYTPAGGDVVTCQVTSNAMCVLPATASANLTITILTVVTPSIAVTVDPNDTLCAPAIVTCSVTSVNGGATPSYTWTKNGTIDGTGDTYSLMPANGDIIRCLMNSSLSCLTSAYVLSDPIIMRLETPGPNTITIAASAPNIIPGANITFTAAAPYGGSAPVFQWYVNSTPMPGASSRTYTTNTIMPGDVVNCSVWSSNICVSPAMAVSNELILPANTGINDIQHTGNFTLTPNPTTGAFTISGFTGNTGETATLEVTNVLGQIVYRDNITIGTGLPEKHINLPDDLVGGIYLLKITANGINDIVRFTLVR